MSGTPRMDDAVQRDADDGMHGEYILEEACRLERELSDCQDTLRKIGELSPLPGAVAEYIRELKIQDSLNHV